MTTKTPGKPAAPARPSAAADAKPATAQATAATPVAPPGYRPLTPFDKKKHAGMGLETHRNYRWAAELNAMFVNAAEFGRAALDYPLVFVRAPGAVEPLPAAVLSLEARRNLFVDAEGRWRASAYVPAYARRHPFCIVQLPGEKTGDPARNLVCVEDDALVAGAKPLLDANGEPTAEWAPLLKMMEAMEAARTQTAAFGQRLDVLGLLTPFDALALPNSAKPLRLQGMLRVDEAKLAKLDPRELKNLLSRGELRAIYAHLLSLENFAKLLDLSQAARGN